MMSKTPAFGKVVNSTEAPTTALPSTQAPTTQTTTTQSQETSTTQAADEKKPEEKEKGDGIHCDAYTSCPDGTTCCFMKSTQKWGCCPLKNVSPASSQHHRPSQSPTLKYKATMTRILSRHSTKETKLLFYLINEEKCGSQIHFLFSILSEQTIKKPK